MTEEEPPKREQHPSREETIKKWLKKPTHLALIAIILFATIIRLFYFNITKTQTVWWDEAEYLSMAVQWAFDVPYVLNAQRPPLFPFISSLALNAGFGELFIKFFFVLIPSTLFIIVVYYIGKEMYNEHIGLIGAFLTAVSWTLLFWGARVQPDFFSLLFQGLAILFMWKYWKNPKTKPIILAGLFAALGFLFKVQGLLVPLSFMVFILIKDGLGGFKNKHYYFFAIAFLVTLIPYFFWSQANFGTPTGFTAGYSSGIETEKPFTWSTLGLFLTLNKPLLYVLFLLGLVLSLKFVFYLDILYKDKKNRFKPEIFSLIVLAVVSSFYIFYIRGLFTEDRWVFLWVPFMSFIIGTALMFIYKKIKPYSEHFALLIVLGLLFLGAYAQISHAHGLIENKKTTYKPVELGGIWMKENSEPGDLILTRSRPQHTYYAQREVYSYNSFSGPEELESYIQERKPKFFVWSRFESVKPWTLTWIQENPDRLEPVQGYFADQAQKEAVLVIYQIKYDATLISQDENA